MCGLNNPLEPISLSEALWNGDVYWFWCGFVFLFGLLFGSFFNVCIYRLPAGLSPHRPRWSFCFRCGSRIKWYDNLPVFSYFALGGKCRSCGAGFSSRYAIIEFLTGALFLAVFMGVNPNPAEPFQWATFWFLAFTGLLIVGSFTDIDAWIIPDGVSLGGAAAALAAALVIGVVDPMPLLAEFGPFPVIRIQWGADTFTMFLNTVQGPAWVGIEPGQVLWWEPLVNALIGAAFGSGLLYSIGVAGKILFRKDAMGMGDVKLFALIGATLGLTGVVLALMIACVVGAAAGIAGKVASKLGKPGPSILRQGPEKLPETEHEKEPVDEAAEAFGRLVEIGRNRPRQKQVHHLPFGPWIAVGAILVVIFQDYLIGALQRWFLI